MSGIIGVSPNMKSGVIGKFASKPAFYVYGGTGIVGVAASAKIPWTLEVHNQGGHFDLTNEWFVVPQSGLYQFFLLIYNYHGDNSQYQSFKITKEDSSGGNSSSLTSTYVPIEQNYADSLTYHYCTSYVNAGWRVYAQSNSASTQNIYIGGHGHSNFQGILLG